MTLVEVVVSLGLLGLVTLSVLSLVVVAMHLNDLAEERTIATSLAVDRVEQVLVLPFHASSNYQAYRLSGETAAAGPPPSFTADYGQIPGYPRYRRIVELRYDVPVAGMLAVEARVSWRQADGQERTHTMVTYLNPALE